MNIFEKLRSRGAETRLAEEMLYQTVVDELSQGVRRDGLWAKAYADSYGHEAEAKARYIKLRVQSLLDEFRLFEHGAMATEVAPNSVDRQNAPAPRELLDQAFTQMKQGQSWQAIQIYNRIVSNYPKSPEAKIAKENLKFINY